LPACLPAGRASSGLSRDCLEAFRQHPDFEPVLGYLDTDRPQLRASLIAGQVFGFGITHYLLELDAEAATPGQLGEILGRSLQRLATEPL